MGPLYVVQNTAKINKNRYKFVIQYYGRLTELFDFNKLAKFMSCQENDYSLVDSLIFIDSQDYMYRTINKCINFYNMDECKYYPSC